MAFGDVCLIPNDIKDNESRTSKQRGLIAIALMPLGNASRDVLYLSVATMRTMVRNNKPVIIPTPNYIVDHMRRQVNDQVAPRNRDPVYRNSRGVVIQNHEAEDRPVVGDDILEAAEPELPVNRVKEAAVDNAVEQEFENRLPHDEEDVIKEEQPLPNSSIKWQEHPWSTEHQPRGPPVQIPETHQQDHLERKIFLLC